MNLTMIRSVENITQALALARKKGLEVKRNSFKQGWTITLPNQASFHAQTDLDMVRWVRGY